MYDGTLVIDSHGHMSTPPEFRGYAYNMIALRTPSNFHLTAAQMEGALSRHIRVLDERNIDVQMISPRPVAYMHWERPYLVKSWTETTPCAKPGSSCTSRGASKTTAPGTRASARAPIPAARSCSTYSSVAIRRALTRSHIGA